MDTLSYKTVSANAATVEKEWFVIDATNMVVGRLASRIALILRGKHKPSYTPHVDCGDNIIVINAEKIRFTGKKMTDKTYYRYTGHPGGKRMTNPATVLAKHPERILEHAVKGMLPKNRLGRRLFHNLFVYVGPEHPHAAQQPKELDLSKK